MHPEQTDRETSSKLHIPHYHWEIKRFNRLCEMAAREYRTGTGAYLASASAGVTEALTLSVNAEVRDGVVRQQWYSAGGLDEHQSDC